MNGELSTGKKLWKDKIEAIKQKYYKDIVTPDPTLSGIMRKLGINIKI